MERKQEIQKCLAFAAGYRQQISFDLIAGYNPEFAQKMLRKYQLKLLALRSSDND